MKSTVEEIRQCFDADVERFLFQLDLLRQVGFAQMEVLHKNICFAAFGAMKG